MWFKNLLIYRLAKDWAMTKDQLENLITPNAFAPCGSLEMGTMGWIPPRDNGELVYSCNRQFLLHLCSEKKLLPNSVVMACVKERAKELEEQQGFKPGKKQLKELKEQMIDELLPKAFSLKGVTRVWIDPINGWLVIDSSSSKKADDVLKLLLKAVDNFPVDTLRTVQSPSASMTNWLGFDEAPAGFTIDQDTELRASNEGKATVRYVRHTLENPEVKNHINEGKQCTKLALTWNDKISFVLDDKMVIRRITPLDVLKENDASGQSANEDERFDADFTMMTGELNLLMTDVIEALGGFEEMN